MVRLAATRSGAAWAPVNRCSVSAAWSSSEAALGSRARPFSLSSRRRRTRSNSVTPSVDSSSAIAALAADCERATRSAPERVEPVRAVATNTSSCRKVTRSRWGSAVRVSG
jgi:hypothetical protein